MVRREQHIINCTTAVFHIVYSGESSSHHSNGTGDDRTVTAMTRAVTVHPETTKVMYFA